MVRSACHWLTTCTAVALFAPATTANAQQTDPATAAQAHRGTRDDIAVEDIVVTAQRRSERLQDVPIAVAAVSATKLEQNGIRDARDLTVAVSGLNISAPVGQMQPRIRGVGSTATGAAVEHPVAVYVDGVYIASSAGSLLTLNNIERVEVLKGPQGTLFGRNATGGLIQIITKDPSADTSARFGLSYGNFQTVIGDAYLSTGVTETLAGDVALHYEHQGEGWGKNLNTGRDVRDLDHDFAVRTKWLFEPSPDTQVRLAADYADRQSTRDALTLSPQRVGSFNNYLVPPGAFDINQSFEPETRLKSGGVSLDIQQSLGAHVTLRSISAYRKSKSFANIDSDRSPLDGVAIFGHGRARQFSQELQLSSRDTGPLKWVIGAFYFHANDAWDPIDVHISGLVSPIRGVPVLDSVRDRAVTNSIASYAQASYEVLPRTNLTLGGRYTHERKRISGTEDFTIGNGPPIRTPVPTPGLGIPTSQSYENFSYRISLDHKFDDHIMAYVSYNTGFKSGGYNLGPKAPPFKPEKIGAAEIGLKSDLFDNRLRINVSGYHYDYTNIQVSRFIPTGAELYNGAKAEIWGADLEVQAILARGLSVNGGIDYNHAKFTSFPDADFAPTGTCTPIPPPVGAGFCQGSATGNRLPMAPRTTLNVGADYNVDIGSGSLDFNITYYRSGRYYAAPDNYLVQRAYDLVNASIKWTDPTDRFSLRLWGRNLGDSRYTTALTEESATFSLVPGAPRTYGVTFGYKYP